ncbi:Fe-S cluster assembly protein SufD [Lutibacter sp.]|uniref:Fe-S cluster assembly protein SufD n=1 Tax=Lutibacter sp. TaxID=1925666 RepID=UPI00273682FD|nr:Fe-S cluster assembly protein SufD [Lutibacter sp.]MDP3314337.1 Fe-S cluster assembly protein SufD [Lutibacter sp.]
MELKEKLISSFLAFENKGGLDLDSNVHAIRTKAMQNFEKDGFPAKKDEEWKYTNLASLLKTDFNIFLSDTKSVGFEQIENYLINDLDAYTLIFVDGVFNSFLSTTTHEDCDVCVMSSALTKPKYKMIIDNYFNKLANENNSLSELNTAFVKEGSYINIPKNTVVIKPIQLLYFSTEAAKDVLFQPRNLIIVGENSHVQIIERHQNLSASLNFTNSVTEIFAHKRAIIDYYKIQNDSLNSSLVDSTFISQKQQSIATVNTYSFGGKLTRNNLEFHQEGEHITSYLNGISILNGKQHVDNHTLVNHKFPNCESHELYKGIYSDKSVGVFNGKVIVQQAAQKTNAFQQNNNILLHDGATINAKPQLEIFADDVKCSHGCTIGQLDESALFYMQSRGIPKESAKALLLYAFANDVVEKIKIPQLKTKITTIVAKNLAVDLGFEF